eukprot:530469-Alexandrium_andersonii.AAC.1
MCIRDRPGAQDCAEHCDGCYQWSATINMACARTHVVGVHTHTDCDHICTKNCSQRSSGLKHVQVTTSDAAAVA